MPYKGERLTLVGFLCSPFVDKVTKTSFFGVIYLRLIDFFGVASELYTIGAVLGRARRNKLNILAKLLVVPGTADYEVDRVMTSLEKAADKRLEEFRNRNGREPDTFSEFCFFAGIEGALEAEGIRLNPQDAFEVYVCGDKKLKKLFDTNVKLKMAEPDIKLLLIQGICFGASFPELTERMYRKAKNVEDAWHGLAIPKELKVMSLEEGEEALLQTVAAYTSEYYPELVDPLDLRGYLDKENTVSEQEFVCDSCGAEVNEDDISCPKCGAEFED